MDILLIGYDGCSTCRKAKAYLRDKGLSFADRPIVSNPPTVEELTKWQAMSGLPLKRFFNTSGKKYQELKLKDRLSELTEDEQKKLLSENGMLVKRPILVTDETVLLGFKIEEWDRIFA